ncbi:MAG TPA: ATP-binding protein [Polyangiaceae bacterium]|jgi:signal transduction histidine kinase|nr:ATP-binding protein [Polyangiaceae bacterium]
MVRMPWVKDFRAQAMVGFAAVIATTVAALVAALVLDHEAAENDERLLATFSENELVAVRIESSAEKMVAASRGYLLTGELSSLDSVRAAGDELESTVERLENRPGAPDLPQHLVRIKRSIVEYRSAFDTLVGEARAMPSREAIARAVEEELLPRRTELDTEVEKFVTYMERLLSEGHAARRASASRQLRVLSGIGGAGVLLAVSLAVVAARRLDALYESERAAKRQKEGAVRAREDLIGIVAHDLRNPLSAILMKACLIRGKTTDDWTRKSAESIESVAARMEYLIRSLLDAARIEAGHFSVARESCAVAPLLSSTLEMFSGLAAQKAIALQQNTAGDDLVVCGDREQIIQTLSNLLSNAMKFTPGGGKIDVRVSAAASCVRFEVRDDGPGISGEHITHLFDRYWKADVDGRRGSGLGLYIAKGIVDAHGGRIWVESEPGRGSAFIFEIPTEQKQAGDRRLTYETEGGSG